MSDFLIETWPSEVLYHKTGSYLSFVSANSLGYCSIRGREGCTVASVDNQVGEVLGGGGSSGSPLGLP